MADQEADVKPADTLTLGVKDQNGEVIHFKIKRTTKFEKVLTAYAQRKGVASSGVRLLFDGKRLNPHATPDDVGMEDGEVADAMLEQTGGC